MGMAGYSISPVTNDPERESNLRASPDGLFLLFNIEPGETRPAPQGRFDFLKLPEKPRVITPGAAYQSISIAMMELGKPGKSIVSQQGARDPSWLADSKTFVFSMLQGSQALLARTTVGQQVSAVSFLSPSPCVSYDQQPSISPDGKIVLFTTATADQGSTIATMELKAGAAKCKVLFPGAAPQWNPSGRSFVFQRTVNGSRQLFVFEEAQNLLTQITFPPGENYEPSWSPEGKELAFTSTRAVEPHIYTITVDGIRPTQITQGPTTDHYPVWGRDGRIFFVSNAGKQEDIWLAIIQPKR
jgi:TolB protein